MRPNYPKQSEEDEALAAAVGLLNSEEDDDMGEIEEEDSDDEDYTFGDSDHDNDKADEADDDYDSDDGRLEDDDDNDDDYEISSTGEIGKPSDAMDDDLDRATADASYGSDDSDYDSTLSEGDYDSTLSEDDPTSRTPGGRDRPTSSPEPQITLGSADSAAVTPAVAISTTVPPTPPTGTVSLTPTTAMQHMRRNKRKRSTLRYRQGIYTRAKTTSATPTD